MVKARLEKIHLQLLQERLRYRVTPQGATNTAPEINADLGSLAQAMWEIDVLRRELDYFNALYDTAQHTPGPGYYVPSYADFKKRTEQVERDQARVQEVLAGKLAEHCTHHPILYRLWNHEVAQAVADAWGNSLAQGQAGQGRLQHEALRGHRRKR